MHKKIPAALILFRLFAGFLITALSLLKPHNYPVVIVVLIVAGLLSDILDGIVARYLKVSTEKLRRLDSSIDQVFWLCCLGSCYILCPAFFRNNWLALSILITLECSTYLIAFIKFRKEVATHAILSKFWTLTILAVMIQLVLSCESSWVFSTCVVLGIFSRLEIIAILLALKKWETDVPSFSHALKLRRGKVIKRNKLFNG